MQKFISMRTASIAMCSLLVATSPANAEKTAVLPQNASAGECFARVASPAKYESQSKKVMVRPERENVKVIPAQFEYENVKVMVQEERESLQVVPATYKNVQEKVLVKPASKKIVAVPAQYKTVFEKVEETPARTAWKKGRGPIEKVDNSTGEIMCKVEVPATFKTIEKQVLVTPPSTREIEIEAVYETISKQVIDTPPTVKKVTQPAKFRTVRVQKEVKPAEVVRNTTPAEFKEITSKVLIAGSASEWKPILCQTNMDRDKILQIQQTLRSNGYNPGDLDGVYGGDTQRAIKKFQRDRKLSSGGLTLETLKVLGLDFI